MIFILPFMHIANLTVRVTRISMEFIVRDAPVNFLISIIECIDICHYIIEIYR